MKKSITLIFALSALLLAGCCSTHRHVTQWEYKQVFAQVSDEGLNKLADEGWSVVCCGTSQTGSFYVLKRAKR